MNNKIKEAMKKEEEIKELVNSAKNELYEKVSDAGAMEGVK
jgi:predicted GIY-YIG superfamily endonuclease